MAIDFSVQNQFVNTSMQNVGSAGSSASIGSLLGQQVSMISSPLSMLQNAAEELTFAVDTTKEFELEERKDRDKSDTSIRRRVEMYQELMHEAGKSKKLDTLKDSIQSKAGTERAKRQEILKQALSQFEDYTDAWAALNSILNELEKESSVSAELKTEIKGAIANLENGHGAEIRTGLHGALAGKDFAGPGTAGIGSVDDMRDLYRQATFDFQNVRSAFKYIKDKYANAGFDKAMDFLFAALSNDIASDQPSMEKTHLEYIHANLGKVRLLQSAYVQCEGLVSRWENAHGVKSESLDPMSLLDAVLELRDIRYLGVMHVEDIVKLAKAPDIEREVLFVQDFMGMLRNFPEKFFDDIPHFQKVMDVVQRTLDKAIEREDEYLANLE